MTPPSQSETPADLRLRDSDPDFSGDLTLNDDGGVHSPRVYVACAPDGVMLDPSGARELREWLNQWLRQREVLDILQVEDSKQP